MGVTGNTRSQPVSHSGYAIGCVVLCIECNRKHRSQACAQTLRSLDVLRTHLARDEALMCGMIPQRARTRARLAFTTAHARALGCRATSCANGRRVLSPTSTREPTIETLLPRTRNAQLF